ncbi:Nitrogen permease regulator 2 [Pestalotiopsis sp. 9143b]|nr:Nitrogen permease regulator 2 [Pestalotiopsis sp. 9143b]
MIQGIFYARFLPQEGTKIVAQSPPGCIVASQFSLDVRPPLVDFDIIQEYIIPRKAFFNCFMTVNTPDNKYSILGFPVSIQDERYSRNEFIFNFGLVVESDCDVIPYERLVRRLAITFAEMEKQGGYLSSEGKVVNDGRRPIESLLEIVKEDLNNYGECMIPVDEANTINMKLFPYHPPPPPVRGWHVPVPKMKLMEIVDATWDLTLQKLIPHIDGVNDVRRIAWLADVSLPLTQTALQHLLYYDTILLLDMFFFSACYAPRPAIHDFIANRDGLVDECASYVCIGGIAPNDAVPASENTSASTAAGAVSSKVTGTTSGRSNNLASGSILSSQRVSNYQLIKLMTTFCVGRSVMEWIKLHTDGGFPVLNLIDVRRLVQFGVIKGLLYRLQKYVVSKQYLALLATGQARPMRESKRTGVKPGTLGGDESNGENNHGGVIGGDPLQKYTDGCHSFDQIITEQNMTSQEIVDRLKSIPAPAGDLTVFHR